MKIPFRILVILIFLSSLETATPKEHTLPLAPDIAQRLQFLPRTVIDYDHQLLDENETKVMRKLVEASKLIEEIYWRQVSLENPTLHKELQQMAQYSKPYALGLRYFEIMKGRWDRILHNESFIGPFGKAGEKPPGAGFYPRDLTGEEFQKWITSHPKEKDAFQSTVTVIQRQDGELVAVPYSTYYREFLDPAAKLLKEAAAMTKNASLHDFLNKRADALLSNDYYASDVAWMDLDSPLEVVIGPYEVYEDGLFNYKASFEAFITAVDKQETQKLAIYAQHLAEMEKQLPEPDAYKNPNRGMESPIKVVQEIYTAGDARKGVMTAAFNLPNDERVRQAKGSKKVLLKNVMQAKFEKTGKPIAERILDPEQAKMASFDPYFNHTLFHELSHGLGPGIITEPDGKKVENRILLGDLYSSIEESKADLLGVWNLLYAMDHKLLTSFDANTLYVAYAAEILRIMRHGFEEAHGRGNVMQWNWCREKRAIVPTAAGRFRVDFTTMHEAVKSLSTEILTIEATGDPQRARKLLDTYGKPTAEIRKIIDQLKDLPVDIAPVFPGAGEK